MNIAYDNKQSQIMESDKIVIREVFDRYIGGEIKNNGFCKCPFHAEKTASFRIFENNKSFYCFGCGIGGNVINLVAKALNINYFEAMKRLDEDYNLDLFKRVRKTEIQMSKEAVEIARKRLKQQQIEIKRQKNYLKLIDYFKWLREQPNTNAIQHDLDFIGRLLDKWLLHDLTTFDRIPEDFDADILITALRTKFEKEGVEDGK